jgi:phosphatidylserine/phosphatidylglycerophosphate/cardiolipin synthase-like enzyme
MFPRNHRGLIDGTRLAIRCRMARSTCVLLSTAFLVATVAPASAQYDRLCDSAHENCRTPLLELIRNETVGIDVGFWFMEDTRYATELIRRHDAGVPVRVVIDSQAFTEFDYPGADVPVAMMRDAGIPMRDKTDSGGIFHFKTMIFAGQAVVEFSGANYSSEAFVPIEPYVNYVDEVIVFSSEPSIVDSFKTRFDDVWTDTARFSNYANVTGELVRHYAVRPIDPELNFVPWQNFRSRSVARYRAESTGIDSIMYRITDQAHTNEMIAAVARGVAVRLISEPQEYRSVGKLWHSWNIDRMYMAGVEIRHRAHAGQTHEKLTLLSGQGMAILGSSNWTSASAEGQHEHNLFTTKPWMYLWARDHFDRKWHNLGPSAETEPFVPLPPDTPVLKLPADGATDQPLTVTLKWNAGPWAHKYDVLLGTDPSALVEVADDVELGPSPNASDRISWAVGNLAPSTTYYWQIVGRTMANQERTSAIRSFRTAGATTPPPAGGADDIVLWAWRAGGSPGWSVVADQTAAGGSRLANANLGAPKVSTPRAEPPQYVDLTFTASAGTPYRLWLRGKAASNSYANDSVWVQFSDSVTSAGEPVYRIGTTSATAVIIEDCSGCMLLNWGWNDNGYGPGVLGPLIRFSATGTHTLRIQPREDGLSIDQIILSPDTFLNTSPGAATADSTIYPEQGGSVAGGGVNAAPAVSLTSPANGASFAAPASVSVTADAADTDGTIARVEFFANGSSLGTDAVAPFTVSWNASVPGTYTLTARAVDDDGASTTSAGRTVTIASGSTSPREEIVLWAHTAAVAVGWGEIADPTAAGGTRRQNPNARAPKVTTPMANPEQYFELTFEALAGVPYRLWMRGKAIANSYENDSVFVQFSGSVGANGAPTYRIGTTSATAVILEDSTNAAISGWGWADNGYGAGVLGPEIYFATHGPQTIRIQTREDGLGIDQLVLSVNRYRASAPGAMRDDHTILSPSP